MEENKWYEKLKNQCPKCKKYDAIEFVAEGKVFYLFKCKFCDYFKKREIVKGSWEMKNGRTYLNGIESELKKNTKGEIFVGAIENNLCG